MEGTTLIKPNPSPYAGEKYYPNSHSLPASSRRRTNRAPRTAPEVAVPLRPLRDNHIVVNRDVRVDVNQAGSSLPAAGNYYFQCSQMPGISELTNLFIRIKLLGVRMSWIPATTVVSQASTNISTVVYVAYNPRNASSVPTLSSIIELNTVTTFSFTSTKRFDFKPRALRRLGDQISTYYEEVDCDKLWLDGDSTALNFYGVDWYIPDTGLTAGTGLGTWVITYTVLAQGTR